MKASRIIILAVALVTGMVHGAKPDSDLFFQKIKLPSGQTAVVSEGDFEARSIGSYSIRVYEPGSEPNDDTTFFTVGIVRERDGSIEKVLLKDVDGDGQREIVVIIRCVGTGSYLSAEAFAVGKNRLVLCAKVAGLDKNADPVVALAKAVLKRKLKP